MVYFLLLFFIAISPIIIIYSVDKWYQKVDYPPPALVDAIYACADEGSIHDSLRPQEPPTPRPRDDDSVGWLEGKPPGPNPPSHPEGLCKEIKKIIHQSIHYCKDCGEPPTPPPTTPPPPPPPPLVLGTAEGPKIEIGDFLACSGDVITGIQIDNPGGGVNTSWNATDLDLPQFCPLSNEFRLGPNNNRRLLNAAGQPPTPDPTREWELLERPRVHHTRTIKKPGGWPGEEIDKDHLVGGPYVVFIAKHLDGICCDEDGRQAVRDKHRVTVFVLYLDWVTEQPTIIEFDVEIERGKDVVSDEDTVQLVSNVRLDSLNRQITFQIGEGARRIVIAGYDFSGQSTTTDVGRRRRSEEDTSGSYRINLTDDGAVEQVYRLP